MEIITFLVYNIVMPSVFGALGGLLFCLLNKIGE